MIINGHTKNQLCCKIGNLISKTIENNIGVPQGNPVSAQLFIIYAEHVMKTYRTNINIQNIDKQY